MPALTWRIEDKVKAAAESAAVPTECPKDNLFVVQPLRGEVIDWAHSNKASCQPGIVKTLFVVQQCFWWPNMKRNVSEFVNACSVCATHKASNQAPQVFFRPLLVPKQPWSHIALDFVTSLLPSKGNTVVLVMRSEVF